MYEYSMNEDFNERCSKVVYKNIKDLSQEHLNEQNALDSIIISAVSNLQVDSAIEEFFKLIEEGLDEKMETEGQQAPEIKEKWGRAIVNRISRMPIRKLEEDRNNKEIKDFQKHPKGPMQ